ncbi:hypothetical protein AKJ51_01655 [candidate division MSBL1 archaeon SCGC-AAA382A20]|uniref:Inosine-5-monophosphate dehydrogenase n=1 Tax=candidate division MSBL1 archaeon SCGC-AAA382A20 TaxID=1698280 RepID=A0A133VLJ5_9EURY|nr:hypothetical protein AKJ51_01655 [candidate division MSBL1 archaeon SCGC-AAA382A20]
MPVEDAMTTNVETTKPSIPVTEVAKVMAEKEIGSVVVVENGEAVGIICERDVLDKVVAADAKPGELTAEDIMEASLITTEPDTNILDSVRLMVRNGIGHLPVVDNETLIGILTVQDVLKAMPEFLETLPSREEMERGLGEATGEGVCEVCGEVGESLVEYNGRWICEECLDFLTG